MEIRVYTKGDDQEVVDLWRESLSGMTDIVDQRIDIKERLSSPSQFFFVASVEGRVIGTALAGINNGAAHLDHIAVKPDHRRRRVGTALLKEAEARVSETGCATLIIQLEATNEAALAFFLQAGYKLEGIVALGKTLNSGNGSR